MSAKANGSAVRPALRDAIASTFTPAYLKELAEQVKTMSKSTFAYCPDCSRKVPVQVPDLPKMISALTDLLEQAEGRPGTADAERGGVTLIIERSWPPPEAA